MISRPTTDQILEDCARELRETVMAAVDDPALKVRLQMMELLLRSCGARAAHEIAWMADEVTQMEAFAALVAASRPDATEVAELLDTVVRERSGDLTLAEQVGNYDRAGRAFSAALALALDSADPALATQARQLVMARVGHEGALRPGFYFPGRT